MKHDRPTGDTQRPAAQLRSPGRLLALRVAAVLPCVLALGLAAPASNAFALDGPLPTVELPLVAPATSAGATPSSGATTVAWFCSDPPAAPCPPQVQYQIIDGVVYDNGAEIGRYVDDEDPTQQQDVSGDRAQGINLVLAGVAQGNVGQTLTGALSALEWYPFPSYGLTPVPPAGYASYILQAGFSWPGVTPPTAAEIQQSYCGTLARHPQLIAFYYWTPASWAAVTSARCGTAVTPAPPPASAAPRSSSQRPSRSSRAAATRAHRRQDRPQRRRQQQRKRRAKPA